MARIRSIKPEFWEDEIVGALVPVTRLVFVGLFSLADDEGRMRGNATFVRSKLFAYDDDTTSDDVEAALLQLHAAGRITLYGSAQRYLVVLNFRKHQRIQKPQPSSLPAPSKHHPSLRLEAGSEQGIPLPVSDEYAMRRGSVADGVEEERDKEWEVDGEEERSKGSNEPSSPSTKDDLARRLFAHWLTATKRNPNQNRLTKKRAGMVRARVSDGYGEEQLFAAIDGIAASPWHQGQNPDGTRYDTFQFIFRDGENVEKGLEKSIALSNRAAAGTPATPLRTPAPRHTLTEDYDDGIKWHTNEAGGDDAAA